MTQMIQSKVKNRISLVIKGQEACGFKFKPDRSFFERVGIGQKRFPQLLENKIQPSIDEVERLAKVFDVDFYQLIDFTND